MSIVRLARFGALALLLMFPLVAPAAAAPTAPPTATVCHEAALPRQRTEVDTDLTLPKFDPALGTLLRVDVPTETVHLDTDGMFQNTAASSVQFSEDMQYSLVFTSPAPLGSPPAVTGTIQRIPTTTLAPFSGTHDFQGPSSVTEPETTRDAAAASVTSTDPAVLAAFAGPGTVPFHLQSTISEVFHGGGGNIDFVVNTFAAAAVQVCYTYAVVQVSAAPPTPPAAVVVTPRFTG